MAVPDLTKLVRIVFSGDDQISQSIASVGKGLDSLSGKVADATAPLANLSDAIIKIDAVLLAISAGALVVATKAAGDFGDSFAEISTLIDIPQEKLDQFRNDILEYAKDSTKSIEDINSSIYNAISAGEDYETSLDLLRQAENLAIATKSDLNTAIEALRPTLNAFGLSTKEAGDFADILFTAVKTGKTTLGELAPVLANVTSIANSSGVSFDQVAAALAGLTAGGFKTSEATTALKGALTGIFAPAEGAAKAAKNLGIEFGKNALEGKTLNEVFAIMVEKTGGTLEGMKQLIPRVEGASAALLLGRDAGGKYANALDAMADRAGAAAEAYAKMEENFELVNQKLINNLKAAIIEIGTPLLDEWGKLANSIIAILQGAAEDGSKIDWGKTFEPLINFVEGLSSELAKYFEDIAKVLPEALEGIDWSGFTNALKDLVDVGKELFGELLGGLDLTKAEDLEKAIQKIIDTFTNWVKLTEGLVSGLAPFIEKIGDLVSKFAEMDEETLKSAGQFLGWGKAVNTVAEQIPNLTGSLDLLSGAIGLFSLTRIPSAITAMSGFGAGATALATGALAPLLAGATALAGGWYIGSKIGEDIPILGSAGKAFGELAFSIVNLGDDTVGAMERQAAHTQELANAALEMVRTKEAAGELSDQVKGIPAITIETELQDFFADIDAVEDELDKLALLDKGPAIKADLTEFFVDIDTIEKTLDEKIEQERSTAINLDLQNFFADVDEAERKIDEGLPHERLLEIKLQGEIDIELAKIKAQAETIQTAFEWTAKVEIAELEAGVKRIEALNDTLQSGWQATADVISSAIGVLANPDVVNSRAYRVIKEALQRELDIQEKLADATVKLTDAEIKLLEAKAKLIEQGKPLIQITTEGLEPELEQVLFSIVQKAQIKATEEGLGFLLGTS